VSLCGDGVARGVICLLVASGVRAEPPRPSPTWDVGLGAVAVAVGCSEGEAGVSTPVGSVGALPVSSL
jgi:hypothetical protein